MELLKLQSGDYTKSVWSGGTTTQLAIAPEGASYAARDFLWRVSSATVEQETSSFTALPDYERLITTIEGEIVLRHGDGAPIRLRPGEVHAFSGADETCCAGRCTDFNLMLRRGRASGTMEALRLAPGEKLAPQTLREGETLLLYTTRGCCTVSEGRQSLRLQTGEILRAEGEGRLSCVACDRGASVILCRISLLFPDS